MGFSSVPGINWMSVPNASDVLRDTGGCLTLLLLGGSSERKEQVPISSCQTFSLLPQPSPLAFPQAAEHLCLPRRSPALFNFSGCGHLLVLGGCAKPGSHLNSGELLDTELPGSKGWELVSNFGCELEGFSCAAFCQLEDDVGFVFGGYDGQQCLDQVLQVDSAEPHQITRLTPLPFGLKNSAAIPAAPGSRTIWLVGGWDGRRTLTTILEYDVAEQSCQIKGLLPYPLEGHAVAFSQLCQLAFIVGGFDGVGLRSEVLAMDPTSGKVLGEAGASLRTARENCVAICYGDGSAEWLAVIGGWDGHRTLGDWELFEVLSASPWLRRADDQMLANLEQSMMVARNRPAAILFHPKSRPKNSTTMALASEDIVK